MLPITALLIRFNHNIAHSYRVTYFFTRKQRADYAALCQFYSFRLFHYYYFTAFLASITG